jgi:hypothetical protein
MPRLVIRKGEGEGKDHALSGTCIVGRHASANFVLGDQLASRNHFRIVSEAGAWFVEDLGSTNGTIVNGKRAKRTQLADGDVIVAGTTELQFVQKDLFGGAPARPAVPSAVAVPAAVPVQPTPRRAVPAAPSDTASRELPEVPAIPATPVARPISPATAVRPAAAVPGKPSVPVPAKPAAPSAPPKPAFQAPVPTKKRR